MVNADLEHVVGAKRKRARSKLHHVQTDDPEITSSSSVTFGSEARRPDRRRGKIDSAMG